MHPSSLRILVIHDAVAADARADELDTLAQAEAIVAALRRRGHRAELMPCGLDLGPLAARLCADPPDVVFNSMESLGGHARLLATAPRLVESCGVPLAGCAAEAIHLTSNKVRAKEILAQAGLPTAPWRTLADLRRGDGLETRVLLKSVWEHSSVGLDDEAVVDAQPEQSAPQRAEDLAARLDARRPLLRGEGFAEAFIEGRELVVGLLPAAAPAAESEGWGMPTVLPPAEIEFVDWPAGKPRLVGFAAKWDDAALESRRTVRRMDFPRADAALLDRLRDLAVACWRLFELGGHARVDFRVDERGRPWILEVNANPCLTPDAGFAAMIAKAGVEYDEAIERIALAALGTPAGRAAPSALSVSAVAADHGPPPTLRTTVRPEDVVAVCELVHATRFFSDEEAEIAVELVEETLATGEAAGYEFIFKDAQAAAAPAGEGDSGTRAHGAPAAGLLAFACFGRVPLTRSAWDLYWIATSPAAQRAGAGRELLRAVEKRVAALGGTHLYIETAGRSQYAPTRAFYVRCGYKVAARYHDFYAAGDDKVVYVKALGPRGVRD